MVATNNNFDQNHWRIITRTSLCNFRNSFTKMFFYSQTSTKAIYNTWSDQNFEKRLKCSRLLYTNNIFDQKHWRIITRTSLCNSRNSFTKMYFPIKKISMKAIVHGSITIWKISYSILQFRVKIQNTKMIILLTKATL